MDTPQDILRALGLNPESLTGGTLRARSPIDGVELAQVHEHTVAQASTSASWAAW